MNIDVNIVYNANELSAGHNGGMCAHFFATKKQNGVHGFIPSSLFGRTICVYYY